ncbi:hypothetical protein [Marinicella sp. W31]|uniref:hypothetical protein n=1 Tax=Marinicella sp. W31 TaxID=3023713 RepID=UPI0037567E58
MKFRQKPLIQAMCLILPSVTTAAEFGVTQSNDDGTGMIPNSLSWAILQANTNAEDDLIVLRTDVTLTGVMKRIIDSNITITSDKTRRSIDGSGQYRPLFVKSGTVTITNMDINNGAARGGNPGGAGMGGSLFVYDGSVSISDVTITNSLAYGGSGSGPGGGGMFGDGFVDFNYNGGGGGLFASANGNTGGYGGYGLYSDKLMTFGRGGASLFKGGFGGGGGSGYSSSGRGGFGGAGGYCYCYFLTYPGIGGFGGMVGNAGIGYRRNAIRRGSDTVNGYGASFAGGAGMGGAIFVRSGDLDLNTVSFINNEAAGRTSTNFTSKGLGGALFVLHTLTNSNNNNQGMPDALPNVSACDVTFSNNLASGDTETDNNNDDIFDLGNRINQGQPVPGIPPCEDTIFSDGFDQ